VVKKCSEVAAVILLGIVLLQNIFFPQMVLVLKKEVVRTNNSVEHEDTGKYRQLLVRNLHQCSIKFPDVASTIIPIVSVVLCFPGFTIFIE
jgi:coatomer subunit beta